MPDSQSLKAKRQILRTLKDRLRNRFNVSVAEIDHQHLWQRATLGVAMVCNDVRYAEGCLAQVVSFVQENRRVEVVEFMIERR